MVKRVVVGVDQWKEVRRKEVGESGIVVSWTENVVVNFEYWR